MSMGSDYKAEYAFEMEYPFGLPCDYWGKKGSKLKLSDMTEAHIKNCMNLVGEDDPWYGKFKEELKRRIAV